MLKSFLKSRLLGAAGFLLAATLCFSASQAAADAATAKAADTTTSLSQSQIETVVHDYIMNHADVILDSVEKYQNTSMQKRQDEALAMNHEDIFNNSQSPQVGNPKADVTVVEFFDYNCHYCKQAFPKLQEMIKNDKNLRVIFKDYPILAPSSKTAAQWALAAQKQGKYYQFHTALMDHNGPLSDEVFEKAAKDIGLDVEKAKKDMGSTDVLIQLEKNSALASQMNFTGTPSFIINDDAFVGTPDGGLEKAVANARKNIKTKGDPADSSQPAPK